MTAIVFVVFLILYIIMTSVGSVGIGLVEDTTAMEVDSVGQEDATYLERGMGAVGIGQQDENEVGTCDGSCGMNQRDREEVESISFDRMWVDLTDSCNQDFFALEKYYPFDIRRLEPSTVAYLNFVLKSTGVVLPIDEVASVDLTTFIWQELCDI